MMDVRVRVGHGKDFHDNEDRLVEIFFNDIDETMKFAEMAVGQGYVVKVGVGCLDE